MTLCSELCLWFVRLLSEMALSDPRLLVFISLCNPLPWNVGGASKLFPTGKIWQKWWDITLMVRWQVIMTSVLLTDSVDISVWMFEVASDHVGEAEKGPSQQPAGNRMLLMTTEWACNQVLPLLNIQMRLRPRTTSTSISLMKIPEAEILGSWLTEMGSHTLKCVLF